MTIPDDSKLERVAVSLLCEVVAEAGQKATLSVIVEIADQLGIREIDGYSIEDYHKFLTDDLVEVRLAILADRNMRVASAMKRVWNETGRSADSPEARNGESDGTSN